jgi:3-methyladenine DNA glycosylase AlkD
MTPTSQPDFARHLAEVTTRITGLAGRTEPVRVDDSGMGRLRTINVPQQRRAAKKRYSFSDAPIAQQISIWDYIWRESDLMEVKSQALYTHQHRQLVRPEVDRIKTWIDHCNCWEHSDDLSKIYADVVEHQPDWLLPSLRRWNRSTNPWKRRQSVVALIEYASKRQRFLPYEFMISQIKTLLDDGDYYVQKGVGWTIREIGNAYPMEIQTFLEQHVARLSSQAWTGATKNMDAARKAPLKVLRSQ